MPSGTLLRRAIPVLTVATAEVPVGPAIPMAIWDDGLHAALEPGVPSPRARLDLVTAVTEAGLRCAALLAPVLFMAWAGLRQAHPELVPRYERIYAHHADVPAEGRAWLHQRVIPWLRKHGLDRQSGGSARQAEHAIATCVSGDEEVGLWPTGRPAAGERADRRGAGCVGAGVRARAGGPALTRSTVAGLPTPPAAGLPTPPAAGLPTPPAAGFRLPAPGGARSQQPLGDVPALSFPGLVS